MKSSLRAVLLPVLVICAVGAAQAETPQGDKAQPRKRNAAAVGGGESYVSVITQHTGEPILLIKYPWKRHARPSVEVRIFEESELDNPLIRPLFFLREIMKGKITTAVQHCQERSEDVAQTATFSQDQFDFEIFGARNSLGRPSVCVACQTRGVNPPPETRAAFCLLDAWSVDDRTLYLELPAKHFSRPSKIRVWLLRDKDVVWTATIAWPGTPE